MLGPILTPVLNAEWGRDGDLFRLWLMVGGMVSFATAAGVLLGTWVGHRMVSDA